MNFSLSNEQKRTILLGSKDTAMNELYSLLVRAGIDPDQFNPENDLPESDISIYGERVRIQKLIEAISLIESKLTELEI
jgi:hypothetical protein